MAENKTALSWTDFRGNQMTREINQVIDIRDFIDTPGYSMLVVAANTNLSVRDIDLFLSLSREGAGRSLSWIQRRRWLFQVPGTDNTKMPPSDADGKAAHAITIMRDNPRLSLRSIVLILEEHGIIRSREWVRKHRCAYLV